MKHRKWLSVLLAVCMLIGCVPSSLAKEAGRRAVADTEMVTTVPVTEKAAPVIVRDGEPEVWVCGVQVTEANADNVLNDNKVKFNFETNTLTFTGKPSRTALHEGALIYAQNMDLTIVTPNNGLSLNSGGDTGVKVLGGALTVNGKLSLTMIGDEVDACIYTDGALTVNGDLDVDSYDYEGAFGVKAMGPVTVTGSAIVFANETCIYCGSGGVTLQGGAYFAAESDGIDSIYHASCIYAADGGVDVKTVGLEFGAASYIIYANGPIRVREDLAVENTGGMGGGSGIVSESGGIVCDGNVNIAVGNGGICLSSRNAAEGIAVGGDAVLSNNYSGANSAAISAPGGPIHVTGSLTVNGYGATVVQAKGDITVGGNLDVKANSYNSSERRDNAIKSSDGSVNVTGYLKSSSVGLNVYAKNDITVGGDATVSGNVRNPQDYILRAETGKISVGGALTVTGQAPQSVYAAEAVTVNGNATVTNTAEGSVGMESDGKITFVSGKWDVDAGAAALRAKEGIVIPAGFGITLPEGGRVLQKDGSYTVVEADLTAVAAHAIIEEKAPADGYYLIGGPVGWVVNESYRLFENPHTAGEYYLDTVLEAGDEIKVVRVANGQIADWYPDTAHNYNGITGNYVVDTDHAGNVTLYFRPDGNPDTGWQPFGGYFYIERDHLAEIEVVGGHGEAYLVKDGVNETAVTVPRLMTVGIQTEPEQYYVLDKIELWKTHGEHDEPELIEELGSESFQMPDYDVIVKVYFKALTWKFVDFTWTGDDENGYTAAVANYECATDPEITRTVDAELDTVTHGASCTEPGSTVYTASVSAEASPDGAPHSEEKSITLPALGHDWGAPTYVWTKQEDGTMKCTAARVCSRHSEHVETEDGTVTSGVTLQPGCETEGETTYTATFTNPAFATQTTTEPIDPLGHDWGTPIYTWTQQADGSWKCSAVRTCSRDAEHMESEDATVTSAVTLQPDCETEGQTTYTATFTNPAFETQTQTVTDILPLGHDWGEPTYTWTKQDDGTMKCTAARVCSRHSEHVETEDATVTSAVTLQPGCETEGETTYTATFTNPAFATQTWIVTDIDALGHDWLAPTFAWTGTDDGYTVDATFVCGRDATHTVTLPAAVTCEEDAAGNLVYTATVTAEASPDGEAHTDTLTVARYTVEFVNEDGTVLQSRKYKAGELPVYEGETPVKEDVLFHIYTFTGWDKEIAAVTGPETYTAVYDDLLYAKVTGMTLALEGKIGINFWLKAPDEASYAVITFMDEEIRFELTGEESPYWRASSEQYRLPYSNVAIKQMMDPATIRVYKADGEQLALVHNSLGLLEDASWSFRVADWAYAVLAQETSTEESLGMAKALINLGNAAQNYFNYEKDDPANPGEYLKDETNAVEPDPALDPVIPSNAKSVLGYKYVKLNLEGDTEIRIFFDRQVTAKRGSKPLEVIKKGKEGWYVSVPGIAGVDLDVKYAIKVTYGGKTLTFKYSVLSFCNRVMASETSTEEFVYLAKALYIYNQAAEIYFNKAD
ncbi:MAG: hypothetical protein J5493_02890 [Lachnospiraceae bacterium]|nr:hypothetical protein [Lachnospiraceae bacterium]